MNELASILQAWRHPASGPAALPLTDAVLATVVHVKGSAYRRPGARMLILPDGTRLGTISGGCLESDVARKATWWTSQNDTALRSFDTSSEQAAWEFGLGCNGIITLLLERLSTPSVAAQLRFLDEALARRQDAVVVSVIRSASSLARPGDRLFWNRNGLAGGALARTPLAEVVADLARRTLDDRVHRWDQIDGLEFFAEYVAPPPRLLILGAGHDVLPVVAMARLLGWHVTVADHRSAYARPERFPGADHVIVLPATGELDLGIDEETAVVMMTHNYPQDVAWLPRVLARSPRYLGLLGPRRRAEKLFAETGLDLENPCIHAPIGLDVGSDHPETVALAIVSEIQAVLSGRDAGFLRNRAGSIHGPRQGPALRTAAEPRIRGPFATEPDLSTPASACRWSPEPAYA